MLLPCVYPDKPITAVFHKGFPKNNIVDRLAELDVQSLDAIGHTSKLTIYDDCYLHVGFRVHGHIYALSKRRPSILIQEDARGHGVNSSLGLPLISVNDAHVIDQVKSAIVEYEKNGFKQIEWAFERMRYYFDIMLEHISSFSKI